jgi:hypothetical protein
LRRLALRFTAVEADAFEVFFIATVLPSFTKTG